MVLVVLIAGPWVSSAIRNQFNLVAGSIGSGTTGENFYEPEDIPDSNKGTAFAVYSADDHSSCSTSAAVCPRRETCSTTAG